MFTESKVIKQITILPQSGGAQVQWANQVKRNDEVISETFERKAYEASLDGFNTEVGALDVNAFLSAFNTATLDAKVDALAAKATAEAALSAANTAHATALEAKDTEHAQYVAALELIHTQAIAAKDAEIAALEAQVAELAPPTVNGVPQVVTRRQARQALLLAGLLDSVDAAIAAIPDTTQRRLAQIEWDDSQNFERQRPLLISLATGLGLTSAQLDQLFVTASGL